MKIDVRQCGGIDALVNTLSSNHDELKVHSCVAIHNCLAGADRKQSVAFLALILNVFSNAVERNWTDRHSLAIEMPFQ